MLLHFVVLMPSNMVAAILKLGPKPVDSSNTPNELDSSQRHKELFMYKPFRYVGLVAALSSLAFGVYAIVNKNWITAQVEDDANNTNFICKFDLSI